MGYPTKVQRIERQAGQQFYVNFPAALARAMDFQKGEVIEWTVQDKNTLVLRRAAAVGVAALGGTGKKKR